MLDVENLVAELYEDWWPVVYKRESGGIMPILPGQQGYLTMSINPYYKGHMQVPSPDDGFCLWCGSRSPDDVYGNCLACGGVRIMARG